MAQAILKKDFFTNENSSNTIDIVEKVKNYIQKNDCPDLSMDISHLNIIDASKVSIICSTYHWAKYPNGKINWLINSSEVNDLVSPSNLGNINFTTAL